MARNNKFFSDVALAAVLMFLVAFCQFSNILDGNQLMAAGDSPPVRAHDQKVNLHDHLVMGWNPYAGPGAPGEVAPPDWQSLVYLVAPEMKATEWIMAISLILAGLFFYLFLRERGYSAISSTIGGIVFGFSSSLATFSYAGHIGRFVMMAYCGGAFWTVQRAIRRRSFSAAVWGGLFMAYAMMNDGTTGLLMMLGLAALVLRDLIELARNSKPAFTQAVIRLALVGVVALVVIAPQAAYLKAALSDGADPHAQGKTPQEHWEWATQWSYPPQELLAFVSAGYYGLDSWNPQSPYWGALGRSFDWETTHQGFRNFSQTNAYLGLIPIMLVLTGLVLNMRRVREKKLHEGANAPPSDLVFWLVLGIVSLLTSFGRYFPILFKTFTALPLPLISSFRNPVKFLVLINLCVAVLAAQGVEAILPRTSQEKGSNTAKTFRTLMYVAIGFVLLFACLMMSSPWASTSFAAMLESLAMKEQAHFIEASMRDALMVGLGWSLLVALVSGVASVPAILGDAKRQQILPLALGLLTAFDFIGVNRHYVHYDDARAAYADNDVLTYLQSSPEYRVLLAPPNYQIFPMWAAQQSRFFRIRSLYGDGQPASILPIMSVLNDNQPLFYDLLGVRTVILPRQMAAAMTKVMGPDVHEVKGFSLGQGFKNRIETSWQVPGSGELALMENPSAYPTPKWYAQAIPATDRTTALGMLANTNFDASTSLIVEAPQTEIASHSAATSADAHYRLSEHSQNHLRMEGTSTTPGWLFVNEPFHPDWHAEIDGKPAKIYEACGLFRAIPVEAGTHTVVMTYRPKATMFWMPLAMVGAASFFSLAACIFRRPASAMAV